MIKELPPIETSNPDKFESASDKKYGYVYLTRAKKSHNWTEQAYFFVAGDVCARVGDLHFISHSYFESESLARYASMREWNDMQKTYATRSAKTSKPYTPVIRTQG